jgi:Suppressor of fused protein (SUFU)
MNVPAPIRCLAEIADHIREYFGNDCFVLHEKESSTVHVGVHVVRPTSERPFFTLLPSGMSDLDMHVPDYTGIIFLEPMSFPEGAECVETHDRRRINYLALIPLLRSELLFAIQEGSEALAEKLDKAEVCELISPQRPSVV